MLTQAEISAYKRDGYLPGRPLLSAEEAGRLKDECLRTCLHERKDGTHRQASNRVKPYLLFRWAADLVRTPAILDAVEALIGPDILVFHTTVWLKEPGRTCTQPFSGVEGVSAAQAVTCSKGARPK